MTDDREEIARVQHEIWSHWMKYLFLVCHTNHDATVTIPAEKAIRWKRQLKTAYSDLSDKEKESDKSQADKVLKIVGAQLSSLRDAVADRDAQIEGLWQQIDDRDHAYNLLHAQVAERDEEIERLRAQVAETVDILGGREGDDLVQLATRTVAELCA